MEIQKKWISATIYYNPDNLSELYNDLFSIITEDLCNAGISHRKIAYISRHNDSHVRLALELDADVAPSYLSAFHNRVTTFLAERPSPLPEFPAAHAQQLFMPPEKNTVLYNLYPPYSFGNAMPVPMLIAYLSAITDSFMEISDGEKIDDDLIVTAVSHFVLLNYIIFLDEASRQHVLAKMPEGIPYSQQAFINAASENIIAEQDFLEQMCHDIKTAQSIERNWLSPIADAAAAMKTVPTLSGKRIVKQLNDMIIYQFDLDVQLWSLVKVMAEHAIKKYDSKN